jgi:branched-chain amino acid transport system permease protein
MGKTTLNDQQKSVKQRSLKVTLGRRQQLILGGLVVLAILPFLLPSQYAIHVMIITLMYGGFAMAFSLTSIIGIFNGGIAAFIGLGAYASALAVINAGISPFVGLFIGGLAGALLGLFAGALTLRFHGLFLAMFTIFLAEAVRNTLANLVDITRGYLGLSVPPLFPLSWGRVPYFYLVFALVLAGWFGLNKLIHSKMGLAMRSLREDPVAAEALGVDTVRLRVLIFTLSCFVVGIFGSFYAHYIRILTPDVAGFTFNVLVLTVAVVGGRATLHGGFLGAFIVIILQDVLLSWGAWRFVIYGLMLIFVMIFVPDGLISTRKYFSRIAKWFSSAKKPSATQEETKVPSK